MGLLGGIARVAVISGTATATSNAVNRRMAKKNVAAYGDAQQQYTDEQGQPAPAMAVGPVTAPVVQPTAAPAAGGSDLSAQLQQLGDLKAQGVLSDEEFAAAKAKLLGT